MRDVATRMAEGEVPRLASWLEWDLGSVLRPDLAAMEREELPHPQVAAVKKAAELAEAAALVRKASFAREVKAWAKRQQEKGQNHE